MPEGYELMLKDFVREVLRKQPADIEAFGLEFFTAKAASSAPPPGARAADASTEAAGER